MKITDVEAYMLTGPPEERGHWVSHYPVHQANELLIRLKTDEGLEGFGLGSSRLLIKGAAEMFNEGLKELIIGEDALAPERLYEKVFSITHQKLAFVKEWSRNGLLITSAAIDLAMWDLLGKASGQPLFRLFGGYREEVPCYVTCAYYREGKDLAELREEMEMLRDQGHRAFKAKIGGASLAEDMERLRVIREVIGDEAELMLDVNSAWDLPTAIEGARLLKEIRPRWLEEPVRWFDDRRELKILRAKDGHPPLRRGERTDRARRARPAGRAGDRHRAVRLHAHGRIHHGQKTRGTGRNSTTWKSRRTTTASSTPTSWRPRRPAASWSPSRTPSATRSRRNSSRTRPASRTGRYT